MTRVLIIGDPSDPHVLCVETHLERMGCQVRIWQPMHLLLEQKLTYRLESRESAEIQLQADGESLDLRTVSSLWLRRSGQVRARPAAEHWIESVVERESSRALKAIFRNLHCFKVNEPDRQDESLYKLHQLELAKACGFLIPETLVSNCPAACSQFYEQHNGQVIYKFIDEATGALLPAHHNPSPVYTSKVESADLDEFESLEYSLHLFQRMIPKAFDVRLTVIGQSIFGARIDSQAGRGVVDCRLDYSVPLRDYSVPSCVAESTLNLMAALGLSFGCVDLAVDNEGLVYFLEINPQGQFLWIEDALGHSLSHELAGLLKKA
ncbi:MAG: hypothetical protein K2W95_36100 [Candidatus Obscuribacterales bacterium]|nr:hypothetical protein [Candidatus Obscuribacterales bacterium]